MNSIALIVAIVGGAIYLICSWVGKAPEIAELGRISFFAGLLALLLGH